MSNCNLVHTYLSKNLRIKVAKIKLCTLFVILLSLSSFTFANEQALKSKSGGSLEQVTVTARKVAENLQDTPVAITAMSGDALAASGINNVGDLTKSVPGLDIGNKGEGNAAPYIRGVGQRQNKPTLDPAVAIYMDDVYLGRPDGALMDLADVAGIQVLRGPQGTLFGRNATGGAIVISPKKPTDEPEGLFLLRTGSFNKQDVQLALNQPITDDFYTRIAFGQTKRDGYSTNLFTGNDNIDNENRKFALLQARWLIGDYTTADLAINYSKQNEFARSQHCILHPELEKVAKGEGQDVDITQFLGPLTLFALPFGSNYIEDCYENQKLAEAGDYDKFSNSLDPAYRTEAKGVSLTLGHEFENFDFKSITSLRKVGVEVTLDLDSTAGAYIDQTNVGNPHRTTQWTQEFQFNGSLFDGDLDYTLGVYYWTEKNEDGVETTQTGPFIFAPFGVPVAGIIRTDYLVRETENESFSVFGQGTYHLSDNWDMTLGLRFTDETRKLSATRIDNLPNTDDGYGWYSDISGLTNGLAGALNGLGGLVLNNDQLGENIAQIVEGLEGSYVYRPPLNPLQWTLDAEDWVISPSQRVENGLTNARVESDEKRFKAWTPMLNFSYFFPDNWLDKLNADSGMMYFTWSKGFRAGGLVTENTQWDPETKEHFATITSYEPEEVVNFELGTKMDLFGKLRLNSALYYMDYTEKQETLVKQNVVSPLQIEAQLGNIGAAKISGIELELTYLATENLDLSLNMNYTKAEYNKFTAPTYPKCTPPLSGTEGSDDFCGFFVTEEITDRTDEELPVVTPFKVFTSAQYRLFTPFALFTPRIEAIYSSGYYGHIDRTSFLLSKDIDEGAWKQDSFMTYNARLNMDLYNEQTRMSFYVNNLTDERPMTGGKSLVETFGGGSISYGQPRMWGLELIHKF